MRNIITEVNSRFKLDTAEHRINELEDKWEDISRLKQKKNDDKYGKM